VRWTLDLGNALTQRIFLQLAGALIALGGATMVAAQAPMPKLPVAQPLRAPVQRVPVPSLMEAAPPVQESVLNAMDDASSRSRCISADLIKKATVIDDKTIHVDMYGKRYFAIRFRDVCSGLAFDQSFYYHLSPNRQLCARLDTITTRSGSRCIINKINRRSKGDSAEK
jgi:hypothetical protein